MCSLPYVDYTSIKLLLTNKNKHVLLLDQHMDILINAKAKYELQYKNTIPENLVFWDVTTCPGEKL